MSALGTSGLLAAYVLLLCSWGLLFLSIRRPNLPRAYVAGRICYFASASLLLWCSALLAVAFWANDFSLRYVAAHSSAATPWPYRLTAFWAGPQGWLLLWLMLILAWSVQAVFSPRASLSERFRRQLTFVIVTIAAVLLAVLFHSNNPFSPNPLPVRDALALPRQLQHWTMVFHRPALFAGYAALAMAFGTAVSDPSEPRRLLLLARWVRTGWTFLTLGIALGAWWAYAHFGRGGYWVWDPAENGSLLSWLAATALLHYTSKAARAGGRTPTALAGAGFAATLLAAYLTASDVQGVTHLPSGWVFPIGIAATGAATVWRIRTMSGGWGLGGRYQQMALAAFLLMALSILMCTLWPLWGRVFVESPQALPGSVFNRVVGWIGIGLLISLLGCSIHGVSSVGRVRLECLLSSGTLASVACFCLWYFTDLSAGRVLASWLSSAVAGTIMFELLYAGSPGLSSGRLLAHAAVAVLAFGLGNDLSAAKYGAEATSLGEAASGVWQTVRGGWRAGGLAALVLAGLIALRRFKDEGGQTDRNEIAPMETIEAEERNPTAGSGQNR